MAGFVVYIDEAGDEGFVFRQPSGGSTRWFVLSAAIFRQQSELETVKLVDEVRALLHRNDRYALHFRNLKHEHRLPLIDRIAKARVRTVTVAVHKPSLRDPEKFSEKFLLYRYATRYLLERVSWCCRDHAKGDPSAKVVFSNRAAMSYDDLRDYLRLLKDKTNPLDVRVDWSVIDPDRVEARQHERVMGLQIADAIASGFFFGLELSALGFVEPRYAEMLRPVVYASKGIHIGHGLKVWPTEATAFIEANQQYEWIKKCFQ